MADHGYSVRRDPLHGLHEPVDIRVVHEHQARARGDVVHDLRHPGAVLGEPAEVVAALEPVDRIERPGLHDRHGRELTGCDGVREAAESRVEYRDACGAAIDATRPCGVGPHAECALGHHRQGGGGRGGRQCGGRAHGHEQTVHSVRR